MNSESAPKFSMEELKRMNQPPAHTPSIQQALAQPIVIQCAMPEAMAQIENRLKALEEQCAWQTEYLRRLSEKPPANPIRTQMDELLKAVTHLEQMVEQAGKPKEKCFSLPRLRLSLPAWPTVFSLMLVLAAAALLLLWFKSGGDWSSFSLLNR